MSICLQLPELASLQACQPQNSETDIRVYSRMELQTEIVKHKAEKTTPFPYK